MKIRPSRVVLLIGSAVLAFILSTTGCSSPERRPPPPNTAPIAPAPKVVQEGSETFFEGRLRVKARLGSFPPPRRVPPGGPEDDGRRGRRGGPDGDGMGGPTAMGMPGVSLQVSLENLSEEPLEIRVRDVVSELGNFAARPERVLLAPGESTPLDRMNSRLIDATYEIPVRVVLALDAQEEAKDIMLRTVRTAREPR